MAAVSILSTLKKYLTNGINFWVKDLVIQSNLRFFALNIRMSVPVMWMRTVIKKIHKIFLIAQSCHIQQRANFFLWQQYKYLHYRDNGNNTSETKAYTNAPKLHSEIKCWFVQMPL